MKAFLSVLAGLALLAITGCRTDPAIPILERELRLKDDEIYRLRRNLAEFQDCGSSCQESTAGSSKSTAPAESDNGGSRRQQPAASEPNEIAPPKIDMPGQSVDKVPKLLEDAGGSPSKSPNQLHPPRVPSKLSDPKDGKPGANRAPSSGPVDSDGPALERGQGGVTSRLGHVTMASRSAAPMTPAGDSRQVTDIVLDRSLTGGIADDDHPGDQGLLVVIEPRDRAGRAVDAPAEVNVVVMDPALPGDAGRVARWDFTAAEVAAMFRRTGFSQAIHLTAAWPGDPPAHHKLNLFVRYVTADGRKLVAEQPIEVALPGDRTARQTPSDSAPDADARQSTADNSGPAAQMAARPDDSKSHRPTWSPERR